MLFESRTRAIRIGPRLELCTSGSIHPWSPLVYPGLSNDFSSADGEGHRQPLPVNRVRSLASTPQSDVMSISISTDTITGATSRRPAPGHALASSRTQPTVPAAIGATGPNRQRSPTVFGSPPAFLGDLRDRPRGIRSVTRGEIDSRSRTTHPVPRNLATGSRPHRQLSVPTRQSSDPGGPPSDGTRRSSFAFSALPESLDPTQD